MGVCMCLWLVWFIDNNSKTERRKKQTKRAQYSKCMATHWKRHGRDDDTRSITRIVAQAYSNMLGFFGMCDRLHIYSRIYNQTPCHRTRTHTHTLERTTVSLFINSGKLNSFKLKGKSKRERERESERKKHEEVIHEFHCLKTRSFFAFVIYLKHENNNKTTASTA